MNLANNWKDYEILDMANGEKLERWGNIVLIRPDPQIIWKEKTIEVKQVEEAGKILANYLKHGKLIIKI